MYTTRSLCVLQCVVCGAAFGFQVFFFFKQKTAYERRISDWSSDVCSSDLARSCSPRSPICAWVFRATRRHNMARGDGHTQGTDRSLDPEERRRGRRTVRKSVV